MAPALDRSALTLKRQVRAAPRACPATGHKRARYLLRFFFPRACASALPAIARVRFDDRPSRSAADAARATFALVTLRVLGFLMTPKPPSPPLRATAWQPRPASPQDLPRRPTAA
jgi:hypothetical protein